MWPRWSEATTSPPVVAPGNPWKELKVYPFGDRHFAGGVPAGLVKYQKDAFVLAGSHLPCKLPQSHREQLLVYRGQNQPVHLSGCRPHEAIEVGPLVSPLEPGYRPPTDRRPYAPDHRLEPQPRLILSPELDLGLRMGLLYGRYPLGEGFLKASCSEASAAEAFWGLGTCGLYPTFLRYSKPR